MKKEIFGGQFSLDEFKEAIDEHLERNEQIESAKLEIYADHVELLEGKSEKEIVQEYLDNLKLRNVRVRQKYERDLKGLFKTKEDKRKINENYQAMLTEIHGELVDCINWLKGDKNVDISFIDDIRHKRELSGKSKEEIIARLKQEQESFEKANGSYKDPKEAAVLAAVATYEPMRERVVAIREMAEIEHERAKDIKAKLKKFYIWVASFAGATGIYSLIANLAFGQDLLKSVTVMAGIQAGFLVGKRIIKKSDERKIEKAYYQANEDFEREGVLVNVEYDNPDVFTEEAGNTKAL